MVKITKLPRKHLFLTLLIILALVILFLELTDTTHIFHAAKNTKITNTSANSETKGETQNPESSPQPSPTPSPTSEPGDEKSPSGGSTNTNAVLKVPSGNFVSNHHPTLTGTPGPSMQSVCNTTSGALCQIIFTKDGVTKSLPAQTTDRGGSTFWDWNIKTLGLSEGTWQIQAKATLANQMKTATDAISLEVGP